MDIKDMAGRNILCSVGNDSDIYNTAIKEFSPSGRCVYLSCYGWFRTENVHVLDVLPPAAPFVPVEAPKRRWWQW